MEKMTLYYRQGSSDKVYQAAIENVGDKFVVNFAYGRRGTTLQTGSKTPIPVSHEEAQSVFHKLIKSKTAKGYSPGEDGTPYQNSDRVSTGIHCQLLTAIDDEQVERLIADPAYWAQEKFDGRRLLIRKQNAVITGINRLGFAVALPEPVYQDCAACEVDFIIDGEAMGDRIFAFDALLIDNQEIGGLRYGERYLRLLNLLNSFEHPAIQLVETHFTTDHKQQAFDRLRTDGREGIVFKHVNAPHLAGRPANHASQFKYKFCETASFLVGKINAKRSVGLLLFDGDRIVEVGNVTIPPNANVPAPMQIVEVRYLYAFPGGSVYQPVYLGPRDDLTASECSLDQLKYKPMPEAAAA